MSVEALADHLAALEKENRPIQLSVDGLSLDDAVQLTLALYQRKCFRLVPAIVAQLDQASVRSPVIDFAVAHLGLLTKDYQGLDRIEARWRGRYDAFRQAYPEPRRTLVDVLSTVVAAALNVDPDLGRIAACLRLARILDAEIERLFPAAARPRRLPDLAAADTLPPQTRRYAELPPVPRRPRRVAVACRWWWGGPGSRPHEVGPRFIEGFRAAGWEAVHVAMESVTEADDFQKAFTVLEKMAESAPFDAVLFDQFGCPVNQCLKPAPFTDFADRLRRQCPDMRLVAVYLDPWQQQAWADMREASPAIDFLWSAWPTLEIWQIPALRDKVITLPFPAAVDSCALRSEETTTTLSFSGSVYQYNFFRAFWLAEAEARNIPIHFTKRDHHRDDGRAPLESYKRYLQGLKGERYPLNFSMRQDGTRVYTARSQEALALGCCLVQEKTTDFHHFFTPGRHYLEFDTFDDFHDIARFVKASPDKAKAIGGEAQRFYRAHYADDRIVDTLERILWGERR